MSNAEDCKLMVAIYFRRRIEDGTLDVEDVPGLLARYGTMSPDEFIGEMEERMQLSITDATTGDLNFIQQPSTVHTLLLAAREALSDLPEPKRQALHAALIPFCECMVPTVWSPGDVNDDCDGLGPDERREVIRRFVKRYQIADADWDLLNRISEEVLEENTSETSASAIDQEVFEALSTACQGYEPRRLRGIAASLTYHAARHQHLSAKLANDGLRVAEQRVMDSIESSFRGVAMMIRGVSDVVVCGDPRGSTLGVMFECGYSNSLTGAYMIPIP